MNDSPNYKNVFVLEKSNRENYPHEKINQCLTIINQCLTNIFKI